MSGRPTINDAVARAEAAHLKLDAHEDLCAERYRQIAHGAARVDSQLTDIKTMIGKSAEDRGKDIKGIYDFLWKIAFGLVGGMLGIIGLLVSKLMA